MNRKDEMKELRKTKTLQEIANIYGLTRERVRQIIGNTWDALKEARKEKMNKVINDRGSFIESHEYLDNDELSKLMAEKFGVKQIDYKLRSKSRHALKKESSIRLGAEAEEIVSNKLSELGIKNKLMSHVESFDILLENGIKIDVKSAQKPTSFSKQPRYAFGVRKDKKGEYCDYFICYVFPEDVFYVIPSYEVGDVSVIFIPYHRKKISRWNKYLNCFSVLQ